MNQPITKSSLSDAQRHLVDLLQRLNFGRIEGLHVRCGEPVFDPAPRVIQKLKMGGENAPRPEIALDDFLLKHQVIEMLQAIADLPDGFVLTIEVRHGLPHVIEAEERPSAGDSRHA
jgi:hypothetical protein